MGPERGECRPASSERCRRRGRRQGAWAAAAAAVQKSSEGSWKGTGGIATGVVGLAALGAGIYMWLGAQGELDALESSLGDKNGDGKFVDVSYESFKADWDKHAGSRLTGQLITGVGVVAAGAAIWMLATQPDDPKAAAWTIMPTGRGVQARVRF